jgi:hypothetical protein
MPVNHTKSEVRLAIPSDETEMMGFLRDMWTENGMARLYPDKVRNFLRRGLVRDNALIGVIRGPKEIEASVGLFIGEWWYSDEQHVEDFWNFVREPYRRSDHAKALLDFARWAGEQLQRALLMGVLSDERTAAKVRLYQRKFGQPKGAIFVIKPGAAA